MKVLLLSRDGVSDNTQFGTEVPVHKLKTDLTKMPDPVADVQAVHAFRYRGESLMVTVQGKAAIPEGGAGYSVLTGAVYCDSVREIRRRC